MGTVALVRMSFPADVSDRGIQTKPKHCLERFSYCLHRVIIVALHYKRLPSSALTCCINYFNAVFQICTKKGGAIGLQ